MTTSDQELGLAAANGDRDAFSVLIARHYDRVFGLAFRLLGSRSDAEDLTQDICAALPSKIKAYRGDAKFTTWLFRVVVNAAHDRRRRQAVYAKATEGWGDAEKARQAESADTEQALNWLTNALCDLPTDIRDTMALVLDDMTHAEAAHVLGISEGTVSWRVSEAKKHLRAMKESAT